MKMSKQTTKTVKTVVKWEYSADEVAQIIEDKIRSDYEGDLDNERVDVDLQCRHDMFDGALVTITKEEVEES